MKEDWVARLIETPARIGEAIVVESPHLDTAAISRLVQAGAPSFVKWDARPGNAMMRLDGSVVWFDWEHCGARNALDDFAWLLADEYVPEMSGLLEIAVAQAPDRLSAEEARDYFGAYATFHTAVRLALIVHYKDEDDWWDEAVCLNDDKVRVTEAGAHALCMRGAEFASIQGVTAPLSQWFDNVAARLGVA